MLGWRFRVLIASVGTYCPVCMLHIPFYVPLKYLLDWISPKVKGAQRFLRDNFRGIKLLLRSVLCSSLHLVCVSQPMLLALRLLSRINSDLIHNLWLLNRYVFGRLPHDHKGCLLLLVLFDGLQNLS